MLGLFVCSCLWAKYIKYHIKRCSNMTLQLLDWSSFPCNYLLFSLCCTCPERCAGAPYILKQGKCYCLSQSQICSDLIINSFISLFLLEAPWREFCSQIHFSANSPPDCVVLCLYLSCVKRRYLLVVTSPYPLLGELSELFTMANVHLNRW